MRVVHCKRERYTHYIGRPSVFGNPYRIGLFKRGEAIRLFETYARNTTHVVWAIYDLPADAVLGCWCGPEEACHGDIIIKLWQEFHPEQTAVN